MLKLVASLKENSDYRESEELYCQRWFHQFRSHHKLTNVELSGKAASVDKNAAVKFIPRFQRLVKVGVMMIVKEGNRQELKE